MLFPLSPRSLPRKPYAAQRLHWPARRIVATVHIAKVSTEWPERPSATPLFRPKFPVFGRFLSVGRSVMLGTLRRRCSALLGFALSGRRLDAARAVSQALVFRVLGRSRSSSWRRGSDQNPAIQADVRQSPPVVSHASSLPAPSTAAVDVLDPSAPAATRAWAGACTAEMVVCASPANGTPPAATVIAYATVAESASTLSQGRPFSVPCTVAPNNPGVNGTQIRLRADGCVIGETIIAYPLSRMPRIPGAREGLEVIVKSFAVSSRAPTIGPVSIH
jgi:hypothetical protein